MPGMPIAIKRFFMPLIMLLLALTGCSGSAPVAGGISNGDVLPCPDTPNCVSTAETDTKQTISPLTYRGSREQAIVKLKKIINDLPNTKLRQEKDGYLWWECKSKIFGFIDDLEIYLPAKQQLIQIRSASRMGYSDFGVNRERVEKIKQRFNNNG